MTDSIRYQIMTAYEIKFDTIAPNPVSVDDEFYIQKLSQAIDDNKQLPEKFDWYSDLEKDEDA
ncbi:MAG: hypothetical protein DRH08_01005 [Deltaproteobacteria bacterium]|nr:MAG: hypothetical protein DRH08_01005 [Deltaproteobacteria bacterium]